MSSLNLTDSCTFCTYTEKVRLESNPFDCDNKDLNDFFENDAKHFASQLFGKSYCFLLDANPKDIVCIFTISNDSVKVRQLPKTAQSKLKQGIPNSKQNLKSYPAVLIGRLGVDRKFRGNHLGSQVLDNIKAWFRDDKNKTGCRFVVVDAYNKQEVLDFYRKNDFKMLFDSEQEESEHLGIRLRNGEQLHTRFMTYDLIQIRPPELNA